MKRNTSFGTMETLLMNDGKIKSEYLIFEREGRSHIHAEAEHCFVTQGSGIIQIGKKQLKVSKGDYCLIPPQAPHWMIPNEHLEILLVYTDGTTSIS